MYEGEWANDKMNGKGNLTFTSGEFWDGHFKDNQVIFIRHYLFWRSSKPFLFLAARIDADNQQRDKY